MSCGLGDSAKALLLAASQVLAAAAFGADSTSTTASGNTAAGALLGQLASTTQTLFVAVTVNGTDRGVVVLLRDARGDFYADAKTLDDWALARPYPPPKAFEGRRYYALAEFTGLRTVFAEHEMRATVKIPPQLLVATRRSLASRKRVAPEGAFGAYLDYDLSYVGGSLEGRGLSSLLTPTIFTRQGSLSASLLYESDRTLPDASRGGWTRLETAWTRDVPDRLLTWRFGDAETPASGWAHSLRFGGIQIATNFATRPGEVTFPQPSIEGSAAVPSAIDVYVNGALRSRTDVPSGPFRIDSIPVVTGAGEIQIVTRDLLGREQIVTQSFYASERLLRPGLDEYALSVGKLREGFGTLSNEYGEWLVSGVLRRGLTDRLTIEGRVEDSRDARVAGFSLAAAAGRAGVTSVALAVSRAQTTGTLWQVGHEYQGRWFRAGLRLQGAGESFVQPGLAAYSIFPKRQTVASGGVNLDSRGSLGVSYVKERFFASDRDRRIATLSYSRSLRHGLLLSASGSRIAGNNDDRQIGVVLNRALGPRTSAAVTLRSQDGATTTRADYRYELPVGKGFGYRTSFESGDAASREAGFAVNTAFARYSAEVQSYTGGRGWRLQTQGAVAALGGQMFAARSISDGFAVVDTGGFGGVRVYLENREVGTTDRRGRLLVPNLRPFETNRLRIESADLPLTARIDHPALQLVPYYRAGTLASFGVTRDSGAILRALTEDGTPVPEGARARIGDGEFEIPVGLDGRVYLDHSTPGEHVEIDYAGGRCAFDLDAAAPMAAAIVDLGDIVCRTVDGQTAPVPPRAVP